MKKKLKKSILVQIVQEVENLNGLGSELIAGLYMIKQIDKDLTILN